MKKILVIGSETHGELDSIQWQKPFFELKKYDSLIIDLTSFPKNYPENLFKNIAKLKRTSRLFIRDNKEIFCIMDRPFKILFKKIPLNYSWMPFPQKLKINPMLLGKTIQNINNKFKNYMEYVKKWDNELFWSKTNNWCFMPIAFNKSQNPIAATIKMNKRGKIYFLPKPTRANFSNSIKLLVTIAKKEPAKRTRIKKQCKKKLTKKSENFSPT